MNLARLCGGTILALMSSTGAGADIPVRDFARWPQYDDVRLSPNGDYLAVSMLVGEAWALAVVRVADSKPSGEMLRFTRDEHVADFWWVGPNRVVASIGKARGALDTPGLTGELFGMDADGRNKKYLFGYRGDVRTLATASAWMIDAMPQDPLWALVAIEDWSAGPHERYRPIHRINVETGATKLVARPPQPYLSRFVADREGRVRFAGGYDVSYRWRSYSHDVASGSWRELKNPARGDAKIIPMRFSDEENAVYHFSNELDGDRYCIVRQSVADGTTSTVFCDPAASVERALATADRTRPYAAVVANGRPEIRILAPELPEARVVAALTKTFRDQALDQLSWSRDGSKLVFRAYSDRNPGEYFLYNRAEKKVKFLFASRAWIDPATMSEREPIRYSARDGRQIHGYLTKPKLATAGPPPLVVLPHGGPFDVRDDWGWHNESQLLASRGYAVLQVNYRGSGGYGEEHHNAGRKQWGTGLIDDITDGVRWVVERKLADRSRICIYGASYGGYAALMSAVREPDLYRCAIGYVGVYDLKSFKRMTDTNQFQRGKNYLKEWLGDTPEIEREQSPLTHIDKLKAAVMIVHGEEDKRVPFGQAKQLRDALKARNHPHEFLSYAQEEHGFWKEEHRVEFYERMLAFLNKHLAAPPATP